MLTLYIGIGYFCCSFQSIWKGATQFQKRRERIENINNVLQKGPSSCNFLMEEKNDTII